MVTFWPTSTVFPGSKPVCGSPGLIAACHVLHRLCAPRHPPSTLSSLTIKYLRRVVCILIYPILLSKTVISSDQKALEKSRGPFHPSILLRSLCELRRTSPLVRWIPRSPPRRRAKEDGGADRDRTDDLRLAKPPLSQLSYGPVARLQVGVASAPARPRRSSRRASEGGWWAWVDLNYRPHAYQACALTN